MHNLRFNTIKAPDETYSLILCQNQRQPTAMLNYQKIQDLPLTSTKKSNLIWFIHHIYISEGQ